LRYRYVLSIDHIKSRQVEMKSPFGSIMQLGFVVHDVERAALEWAECSGAGPFYVLDRMEMDQYFYRGVRTPVALRLGFGYWGDMQIELIQPLSDTTTLYSDALQRSPGVLNHCATVVSDVDALVESRGLHGRVIQSGKMPTGVKFVYLEEFLPGGYHLELIEATENAMAGFAAMQSISQHWNGDRPVRPISDIGADMAALSGR